MPGVNRQNPSKVTGQTPPAGNRKQGPVTKMSQKKLLAA